MKLTCPECTTQFLIDPKAIGVNGRTVRCSNCSSTWFVAAEPDVMALRDQLQETQARTELDFKSTPSVQDERGASAPALESSVFESSVLENAGPGMVDGMVDGAIDKVAETPVVREMAEGGDVGTNMAGLAPHAAMRDIADRKKARRRLFGVSMIWGVTLAILGTAALIVFLFRAPISEKFPATMKIYNAFGVESPIAGLEFYGVEWEYIDNEGVQTLFVNGKIKNVDRKPRDVALIKLSFKNANGEVLSSWVVEPASSVLASGATLQFKTQYPNPPIDAVTLATSFADETTNVADIPMATQ